MDVIKKKQIFNGSKSKEETVGKRQFFKQITS